MKEEEPGYLTKEKFQKTGTRTRTSKGYTRQTRKSRKRNTEVLHTEIETGETSKCQTHINLLSVLRIWA